MVTVVRLLLFLRGVRSRLVGLGSKETAFRVAFQYELCGSLNTIHIARVILTSIRDSDQALLLLYQILKFLRNVVDL
jgi:hypothetical protein